MRHKSVVRICVIFFLLCITIALVSDFDKRKSLSKAKEFMRAAEEYMNDESFELALWNATEAPDSEGNNILINWWYNQNDDTYYFFVPKSLAEKGLHWMFSEVDSINIDGDPIDNGSLCELTEGTYQVKVERATETSHFKMAIRYSSNIASMFLKTDSGSMDYLHEAKENFESGKYILFAGNGDMYYAGNIEDIHCRGNASWEETDKKSYQIKLTEKKDLLSMGADKQWLLLANAFDSTLMRNTIAFDIAKELGVSFTPDSEYVDVYANGQYIGNYLLTEKIEIDKERVNILNLEEQMELMNKEKALEEYEFFMEQQGRLFSTKGYRIEKQPEDISGGYLLEIEVSDRYGLEASGFMTSRMQPVVFSSPKYASYEQVSYIANRYQDMEDAIFSEDGYSPYTGVHFSEYIDMDSFSRKYLLEELTKNLDSAFTSQFFYKPDDSVSTKFIAGPAWDYDKSIAASGITDKGIDLHDPNGLYAATQTKDSDIWYALYNQEEFRTYVIEIYHKELEPLAREIAKSRIDEYTEYMLDSAINNAIRWQVFVEEATPEGKELKYREKTTELRDFISARLDFLNQEWSVQK